MRKRPIRKAGVTEEKEGVLIDPERDCNRKRKNQGALSLFKIDTGPRMGPYLQRDGPGYDDAGVARFYGRLVRSKNILGTFMQSVVMLCKPG